MLPFYFNFYNFQSRSSSSATSSSASKPDPDDEVDDEEELEVLPQRQRPPLRSLNKINNNRLTSQSPAVPRRNRIEVQPSPAVNRRTKSEARKEEPKREPLTLSSLRAAAGNSGAPKMPPVNNATNKKQPIQASISNASSASSPTKVITGCGATRPTISFLAKTVQ